MLARKLTSSMHEAPFSERLKQARERAGLTQHQLGVLAGLDEEHASAKMNQYEKGVHIPKFPRLKDLANALNVPPAYFYADDDELGELLYSYGRLSRVQRRELLKAVVKQK